MLFSYICILIFNEFNNRVIFFYHAVETIPKLIVMWDFIKWHNYLTLNQIVNIGCCLLEACLEDKEVLVALEKDKTPLLSRTLCQYKDRKVTRKIWTKCWSFDGPVRHNNSTGKRNQRNIRAHCLSTVNKRNTSTHSLSTVNKLLSTVNKRNTRSRCLSTVSKRNTNTNSLSTVNKLLSTVNKRNTPTHSLSTVNKLLSTVYKRNTRSHCLSTHTVYYNVIESSFREITGSKNFAFINLSLNFCETTIYDNKVFLENLVAVH